MYTNTKNLVMSLQGGKKDPVFEEILATMELFIDSVDKFIGVFDKEYPGGDFCAGLTFGMQGTAVLEKVAMTLFEMHLKNKAADAAHH